ncbi:MAG: chromosomal replication initiator protein DnaA [Chlamydiae bacterium]|nr:chromosomal replication initiator protein DnaA [Chlamydiota bacterium]
MLTLNLESLWSEFLDFVKTKQSIVEYTNWLAPIRILKSSEKGLVLGVPNIFVQEYLLENYSKELANFFPPDNSGNLPLFFIIEEVEEPKQEIVEEAQQPVIERDSVFELRLNRNYTFEDFIEGPSNQFVKSAAIGVAMRPGKTYNPLFIHGGVGLGKTHLLHSIGHFIHQNNKKLKIQCITTEGFINDLVEHLKSKSIDQMKRFYRSLDVLLVDDIQFLQGRQNFEEEFSQTFEALINQGKQIVITSDKPPSQLRLSERLTARMEWGLVANIGVPDLETRVAIVQHKADKKGLKIPNSIAFFIAEHVFSNVRQLEGAINRLGAYCRMCGMDITQEVVEKTLSEMLQFVPKKRITVESILKSVASMFNVRVNDLKSTSRTKEIAFPRQVAMYLAKELINDSLVKLASSFGGKTHSTLIHSWTKIKKQMENDEKLRRQITMTKQNLEI